MPKAHRTGHYFEKGRRIADHARGEILGNRKALAWIATNRKRAVAA